MIGILFALAGMLLFSLMVFVNDSIIFIRELSQTVNQHFNHDTDIFPDA